MSAVSPPIRVINATCRYGRREVVSGATLEAASGRVTGLLGPNGSGKSTLLKAISGCLPLFAGQICLGEKSVADIGRQSLASVMAVVPQEPRFGFPFTALEVVLMGRHPHLSGLAFESETDVAIAVEALDRCGAVDLANRPIQQLSSGERQRVVFARALAQQPRVLLLDEPASFLDIRHQVELYDVVRELAAEGCTVLTVLHDLNLAAEYCDRVYLMKAGRIVAGGAVDEAMSYARLTNVFGTEIYVDRNDLTGKPLLAPMSGEVAERIRRRS